MLKAMVSLSPLNAEICQTDPQVLLDGPPVSSWNEQE